MTTRSLSGTGLIFALALCAGTAQAQTVTTITGTGLSGTNDTWNLSTNWDHGIPSDTIDVVVGGGVAAKVSNAATPTYSGALTLQDNSSLQIYNVAGSQNAVSGATGITMGAGSTLRLSGNWNNTLPAITLAGANATFYGDNDWQTTDFSGAITGAYPLVLTCFNGHEFHLNAANSFSELFVNTVDRWILRADAPGSLGAGDVTVTGRSDGRSAVLVIAAAEAMADTATLTLNGQGWAGSTKGTYQGTYTRLDMKADDTVAGLWIDGIQMPPGTYAGTADGSDWIDGTGTLTVTSGPLLTLQVNTTSGATTLLGHSTRAIAINYYQITSEGDSLDPVKWSSLADQDFEGGGPPSGMGDGWEEAGGVGPHALAEAFLLGNSTIVASASIGLGAGYDESVDAQDLAFTYLTDTGQIIDGLVEYFSPLAGDVDNDGDIDNSDIGKAAGSFTGAGLSTAKTWADGDVDGDGDVDNADLGLIAGAFTGSHAGRATVPEPAMLSLTGLGGLALLRRRP